MYNKKVFSRQCDTNSSRAYTWAKRQRSTAISKTYELINGLWFDGKQFKRRIFYAINGIFSQRKPNHVDEVIDLQNGYVVPPFGEAHNHNVEGPYNIDEIVRQYLQDGIFYVKNPNNLRRLALQIKMKINLPTSIDVIFANGGLTASGGHPFARYRDLAKGPYKYLGLTDMENEAYFVIDNFEELQNKWTAILAGQPDFIKTYLLYSEEFEKRRDDPKQTTKGLNPTLLTSVVKLAHKSRLRVSTHIETATDFHNAVLAGVDEINHALQFTHT